MPSHGQLVLTLVVLLAVAVVLLVDVGLLIAASIRRDAERAGLAPPLFAPRWSLVDVWFAGQMWAVATLIAMVFVMVPVAASQAALSHGGHPAASGAPVPTWALVVSLVPQSVFMVAVSVAYITVKYRTRLRDIGLGWPPGRRTLIAASWLCPLLLVFGWAFAAAVEYGARWALGPATFGVLESLGKEVGNQGVIGAAVKSPGLGVAIIIIGGLVVPFAEEVFFRGFLFNAAKRRLGMPLGVLLSACLFALAHLAPLSVIAIVPVGIALALAYERTGSLWVPVLMHACFNTTQLVLAVLGKVSV